MYYQRLHLTYLCKMARYWLQAPWGRHSSVETCRRSMITCEIIVYLLVIVQNNEIKKNWVWYFASCGVVFDCRISSVYEVWRYVAGLFCTGFTFNAGPLPPSWSISKRLYPHFSPTSDTHVLHIILTSPELLFSWLSNGAFSFWNIRKHFFSHSFFSLYFHKSNLT